MAWLIVLATLCALSFLPLGFRAVYAESGPGVWLLIGPFKFRVFPGKPKETKNKAAQSKKESKKSEKSSQKGGSYRDFFPVIHTILDFLGQFRRKIRINNMELKLTLAGDDPADLAIHYGQAWAALGNLMPQLERLFVIKKRNVEALCDFTSDKTRIYARMDATITLGRTIHLLSWHGIKVLRELLELKKLRKGGAKL